MPSEFFDRVTVISLPSTPDRLLRFWAAFPKDWPFHMPEVFNAIDGRAIPLPVGWTVGAGAFGCMESHLQILRDSILAGHQRILVMEDDCVFEEGYREHLIEWLGRLPDGWDQAMIGGQQMLDGFRRLVAEGMYHVSQHERTHCYALSYHGMRSLYRHWKSSRDGHCDWLMGDWQEGAAAYAPEKPFAAQGRNLSTITGRPERARVWGNVRCTNRADRVAPVVLLACPREVAFRLHSEELIYWRPWECDALGPWLESSRQDASRMPRAACAIWGTELTIEEIRGVCPDAHLVTGETYDQVELALRPIIRTTIPWKVAKPAVFFHVACMGNWRNVVGSICDELAEAGLHDAVAGVVGGDPGTVVDLAAQNNVALQVQAIGALSEYEIPTLKLLQQHCRSGDGAVLYMHTKGVSQPGDVKRIVWRDMMVEYLLRPWRMHLAKLAVLDAVGFNWQDSANYPHFSGNWWMARSDWIRRLPDLDQYKRLHAGEIVADNPWERICAEFWIGSQENPLIDSAWSRNERLW